MSTPPSLESLNAAISVLAQQVTQLNNQVNPTPEANFAPFEIRNPTTGHIAQVSHEDPLALLKTINDYDGNPNLLNHWLNKARRINQIFFATDSDTQQKQGHYYTFLLGLESKIIGPAQEVLAKNNYEANFSLMEKLLIEAFGEKKKIEHLLYEIITAEQHEKSNHEFYEYITTRLNQLISSTILKYGNQNAKPLIEQYKMQAVSAYLRGLNGINGLIITGYDPKTLEEAYHHVITMEANTRLKNEITNVPQVPARNYQRRSSNQPNNNFQQQRQDQRFQYQQQGTLYQQRQHQRDFQPFQRQQHSFELREFQPFQRQQRSFEQREFQPFQRQRGFEQREFQPHQLRDLQQLQQQREVQPFQQQQHENQQFQQQLQRDRELRNNPRGEPMEIDRSTRSRHVNYENRNQLINNIEECEEHGNEASSCQLFTLNKKGLPYLEIQGKIKARKFLLIQDQNIILSNQELLIKHFYYEIDFMLNP
ncbi:uncharacterized protein LOC129761178 [Toxorhynchites rutilus septentrionalis]|uniref:uncharacterized protein LOC129761178 n=1 Tax=Toxorhynchites rutilus septentrionalis TaxID=329112 RepID=UPI00247ACB66|nr:uncharacterized protein LOC129761178 [Toxorhynchites rutilus septentrionalis]